MRLRRADPHGPGLSRVRHGRGFRYLDADGRPLPADERARVVSLAIPPAWTDVWVSADPAGHLQATGTDAAGRRQYLYHPEYRRRQDASKHERVLRLADRLPSVRAAVARDLNGPGLTRRRVVATALRMLLQGVFRTGGEEYEARYGTRGVVTLRRSDVRVSKGVLTFRFTAKGSQDREVVVRDPALARAVSALQRARPDAGPQLLVYRDGDGAWHRLRTADVNERFKELAGSEFTVKDLRTWHATVVAATGLSGPAPANRTERRRQVREVIEHVAAELGNTPAVARASYVDPRVVELHERRQLPADVTTETDVVALLSD